MIWTRLEHRLALARLLLEGRLNRTSELEPLIAGLLEATWVRQTSRRRELELTRAGEREVRALLELHWPGWEHTLRLVREAGLPLTTQGVQQWERKQRTMQLALPPLPVRLNQKTLAARFERHSKAATAAELQPYWPQIRLTTDDIVRLRAPAGMNLLGRTGQELSIDALMAISGEVVLPERALLDGVRLTGVVRAILSVENPGAYIDLKLPPGWLAMLIPGWNTSLALRLLQTFPEDVPLVHFGDLDPEGWAIVLHLRQQLKRPVTWFVPTFWEEYVALHALELPEGSCWPSVDGESIPTLVRMLAANNRWLEQEVIVLDPRLEAALQAEG